MRGRPRVSGPAGPEPRLPIGQPRWRQPVTGVGLLNQDCLKARRAIAHLTLALGFVVGSPTLPDTHPRIALPARVGSLIWKFLAFSVRRIVSSIHRRRASSSAALQECGASTACPYA